MEELQSTEVLDREILEDARKKALRVLKTADENIKTKKTEWEKETADILDELRKKHSRQCDAVTAETQAYFPIDKNRIKTKKTEEYLDNAVKAWYARLKRSQILALLQKELEERMNLCQPSGEMRVFIHKIEKDEAESILKKILPGGIFKIEKINSDAVYPEITVDTSKVRIIASIDKTIRFFLDEKRSELVTALLGEQILKDAAAEGGFK
ncbi:MAG: hypothetical protein FWH41_00985 [Treponema sp.]|nr:hypothetical protein [Treponema sp.]